MAKPTLTYGHGFLDDCDDTTGWDETEDGNTATLTVDDGDVFNINVTNSVGNKVAYYSYPDEGGAPDIDIFTATFTKFLARYRTSDASIKAKIELVFGDASTQTVLAETSSTTWKEVSVTTTTGKTLDHIRLFGNQATGDVYYDFVLVYKGIFTFPFVSELEQLELENKTAFLEAPSRVGDIPQYLGAKSPIIQVSGVMNTAAAWGTPDGQYLLDAWKNVYSDPWQWYTSDLICCKVVPTKFIISKVKDRRQRVYDFFMRKYDLSSGDADSWTVDNFSWFGL